MLSQIAFLLLAFATLVILLICINEFTKTIPNSKFMRQRDRDEMQFLVWKMLQAKYELEQAKTQHDRYYAQLRYSTAEHALKVFEKEVIG